MIRIAICDDEQQAINELSHIITAFANENNLKIEILTYFSGEALLSDITEQSKQFNIFFLDIKMNKINGIETAKIIRKKNDTATIIFVSSLGEYVFDAFEVEAKGFIVKPIDKIKLLAILEKAIAKIMQHKTEVLTLHQHGELKKIPFNLIQHCEVVGHTVFVYERETINKYQGKIDALEKELSSDFFRCHRSYIVNLRFVDSYKDNMIYMPSGERIPVAARRRVQFMQALLHFQRKEVR